MKPEASHPSLPRLITRSLVLGAVMAGMLAWHGGQWQYEDDGAARHHFNVFHPWAAPPSAPDREKGAADRSNIVAVWVTVKRVLRHVRTGSIEFPRLRARAEYHAYQCPDYLLREGIDRLSRAPPSGV